MVLPGMFLYPLDFNVPNINWQECMYSQNSSTFEVKFLNATLDSFLTHVLNPFRQDPTQRYSILDLVFMDDPRLYKTHATLP